MTAPATNPSGKAVFVFSSLGHFFVHLCIAFYFVIVLSLERSWNVPYHELVSLWTLGSLMVGLAALPAGMIADRFGAPGMMAAFFIGMGACSIGAGLSDGTFALLLWLTGIGVFAAIYHPVGIPWLVRNTDGARGKALAVNGIFGSFGGAAAGIVSGLLIDVFDWRAAFIVPGVVIAATGVVLAAMMRAGSPLDRPAQAATAKGEGGAPVRVFLLLMVTMFVAGLVFNGTQVALPKLFELRHGGLAGEGIAGIGILVAIVYSLAGVMQLVGGHLADRYPLKAVYTAAIAIQVPLLLAASWVGGAVLVVVATLMVMANVSALPAENMMLARYAPGRRHGLAFGAKFVLAFGAAPLAVQLVSLIQDATGELGGLLQLFAVCVVLALAAALALPALPRTAPVRSVPAGAG